MIIRPLEKCLVFAALLGIASLPSFSCLDQEGDLNIESESPQIVVDGIIVSGQKPVLFVGKTTPTLSNNLTFRIPASSVSITVPDVTELKRMPALFGETDLLKSLTLLPGVSTGLEGTSNIQIRGVLEKKW